MTSNWFGEFGRNYIMAFQETGACSTTPYKCLNIISTELYNSLLEKSKCCDHDDDGNSPTANASANSSPSFQNNFYPQNNLFPSEFNRSLDGPSDGHDRPDDEDGPGGVQNHNWLRLRLIGLRLQQHLNKLTPRILMNRILSIIQMLMVHQTLMNPQMMYLVILTLLPMLMIRRN